MAISMVNSMNLKMDQVNSTLERCRYLNCKKMVTNLKQHELEIHSTVDRFNSEFNGYLTGEIDQSVVSSLLMSGTKLSYFLHIGKIPENLNFTFGSYPGKGISGREFGTVIEAFLLNKHLKYDKIPFKFRKIIDALTRGDEIHVIVVQRYLDDLSARKLETILLGLPFENLINTHSFSTDLNLDSNEFLNLRMFALQKIKNVLNSKVDHTVFNYKSLKQFIDNHSNLYLGGFTIEELSWHVFELEQRINTYEPEQLFIITKLFIITQELKIDLYGIRYVEMIRNCKLNQLDEYGVRFKLLELEDNTLEENYLVLEKLRSEIGDRSNILVARFEDNLPDTFIKYLNQFHKIKRTFTEMLVLEHLHNLEFKVHRTRTGHVNLKRNDNRFEVVQKVFSNLNEECSITFNEFEIWVNGKRHYPDQKKLEVCQFIMKDKYDQIISLVEKIRNDKLNELLFTLNQVMPSHTFSVGIDLATKYLFYLEHSRKKLYANMYVGERRLLIIKKSLKHLARCKNLNKQHIRDLIKNLPKIVAECHCESIVEYLETRLKYIEESVRDLDEFEKVKQRVKKYYKKDLKKNNGKKK